MNARAAETLPTPRRMAAWLEDMTDAEVSALFTAAPDLAERLRVQLTRYNERQGGPPWSRTAILALRPQIERMAVAGEGPTSRQHLLGMLDRVEADPGMSRDKLCTWLGWIQCALVAAGATDLETMKQHNRESRS